MEMLELRKGNWTEDPQEEVEGSGAVVLENIDEIEELEARLNEVDFDSIEALTINCGLLTDEQMAVLLMEQSWSQLRVLNLHASYELGDYTAMAIAEAKLPKLERVVLDWTKVSDIGLLAIADRRGDQFQYVRGIHLNNSTKVGLLKLHGSAIPNAYVTCPDA